MYFSEILALSSSYVLIYCRPWPMGGGPGGNAPEFLSSINLLSPMANGGGSGGERPGVCVNAKRPVMWFSCLNLTIQQSAEIPYNEFTSLSFQSLLIKWHAL